MNHTIVIALSLAKTATSLRYPFDAQTPVLYVGSKMFALLGVRNGIESVNLKVDPEEAWLLRQQYPGTVIPGYHMNKKHWNTVLLNGAVSDAEFEAMLEQSYRLVVNKLTKSERMELFGNNG
ncbi:MAG: MmcQ/YjbR family DNA-binding protein [Candidatus Cohnella colombiensis]|uniref:MmcQ/YjbR family DNA-binding protein n=1 Tax=Candidatus Cohnella colombiensis TaxID=3121368 RepID=A0AA95EW08_9BACL|nr:MAG: MmcQ/YjbR family DNA-binding protein [Cohnella sp.]